jgi:hypothetical protein
MNGDCSVVSNSKREDARLAQRERRGGEEEAAHDRRRDVEPVPARPPAADAVPHEEHHRGERDGLDHVEPQRGRQRKPLGRG